MTFDSKKLESVTEWREKEKLDALDYDQLKIEAGSLDEEIRKKAQRKLLQFFDLSPEKSSEQAKSVDLVELFKTFSPEKQKALLNNLVAFQLTEGCNGRCAFCLFGSKKGVISKFSFDSIQRFFKEYKDQIRNWGSSSITHYWDSDPFDYQDGNKTYLDVFDEWKLNFPKKYVYISTTIPKGSTDNFQLFIQNLFSRYQKNITESCNIRISVGKHNIQKVEAIFKDLYSQWESSGVEKEYIDAFIEKYIVFSPRLEDGEDIAALGPQIKGHDDIQDPSSPACEDGTLLTPRGFEAISMTAACLYQPSGQYNMDITPDTPIDQIPRFIPKNDYQGTNWPKHLAQRVSFKQVLFPLVVKHDAKSMKEIITLLDENEDITFKLGRLSFSLNGMLNDISNLETSSHAIDTDDETRKKYLELCADEIFSKKWDIWKLISAAKRMAGEQEDIEIRAKLEFYALLATVQLKKAEYIARLIKAKSEQSLIVNTALAFKEINKKNVKNLPQVIQELQVLHDKEQLIGLDKKQVSLKNISNLLGLDENAEKKPDWITSIS